MNIDQYIGRLLDDRYEILEVIGTGGMAVVYKARCHRLNRLVAIKILKDEYARDEEFRRRFHAEGEAVAMLSNPNIVQVYDVSSTDTANFIVMELIDGISLKQYMEKKGVLNWKETLHFAMQIAKGLEHAHSRGIVHRDIKPHNVMVLKNGSVKVMDFGIARVMNKSNTLTKEALGSVHYISPEQAKGGYTDNRSDLYSLSVVMYEMMTGRPPYDGESAVAVAIQHINGGAAMPSTLNPNIPGGLEQIIMKGMALDVKDRYVSATEMLLDMEEFRKNPAILFGYTYKTPMSDSTRPITVMQAPPRTTAERVVQNKTGAKPLTRATSDSVRLRQTGTAGAAVPSAPAKRAVKADPGTVNRSEVLRRAQQRRLEAEEQKREDERNRVATIAVVVCSAVAVIAIIVFLVALFNGALLNQEKELVEVPFLLGKAYTDDLPAQHTGLKFVMRPQEYSDDYEKGEVMKQEPSGGSRVIKDTELYITVSMGPEPEVKTMEDLTDVLREEAETFLRSQGYEPLFREEVSDTYAAGKITRTSPAYGEPLTPGQTIKLWVSTGPDVITKAMPGVVGKDVSYALNLLEELGFSKVETKEVKSNEAKGTVVSQSQLKGVEIDVTTEILLEVSLGPEETTAPPTEAETEPPLEEPSETMEATAAPEVETSNAVTRKVTFILPENEKSYLLNVRLGGVEVIEPRTIQPGETTITLELTGTGTQMYNLYIDGDLLRSEKVIFTDE